MKKLSVTTDFNVSLTLDGDTLPKRILAYFIDFIILILYILLLTRVFEILNISDYKEDADRIRWGINSLLLLPIMFYTLIWEVLTNGYTPGKFISKIKVIKLNGYHPTFVDYFIRWIFRAFEIYTFVLLIVIINQSWAFAFLGVTGFVAMGVIAFNKKGQRLGDIIAGTVVTKSKYIQDMSITILEELNDDYKPTFPEVIKLSDNDMRIIKDTYYGAIAIDDYDKVTKLRKKVTTLLGIESDLFDKNFFETIIRDFNYYTKQQ